MPRVRRTMSAAEEGEGKNSPLGSSAERMLTRTVLGGRVVIFEDWIISEHEAAKLRSPT